MSDGIRFRSRFLHATVYDYVKTGLSGLGWSSAPVNFGAAPVTLIDYQPDERQAIATNTVAVSLGDYPTDQEIELGSAVGGTRAAPYTVFVDVFMAEQALAQAICDDVRDLFTDQVLYLVDQITMTQTTNLIDIERVVGPTRVTGSNEAFKRHWRVMQVDTLLYFQT